MGVVRAFIAIDLPNDVLENIENVSRRLQTQLRHYPIKWVPTENIHLTLKFLGDVSESNLPLIEDMLAGEVSDHKPFEFGVGRLGAFPDMKRPRVIWVGVEAPEELLALQRGVESVMQRLGYPREQRPFQPHLTLARIARRATTNEVYAIGRTLREISVSFLGSARVTEVHLYKSDLHPTGAVYTRLFTTTLNASAPPAVA